jgi:hypothetical protein
VNRFLNLSYFDPDNPTSGLTVSGLARVYCNLFVVSLSLTLIYGLFIDVINSSVYIVSSERNVCG